MGIRFTTINLKALFKEKKFQKYKITMEVVGGYRSQSEFFLWKIIPNTSEPVQIFWSSIP